MNHDLPESSNSLPAAVPRETLKQASDAIAEGKFTLEGAAAHFRIDPEILHRFHRQNVRSRPESAVAPAKRQGRDFRPLDEKERANFTDNWEKAKDSTEEEILFTPLAETFSRFPILRRLVRRGEISPLAVFELLAIIAVLVLLAAFLPLLKKDPVASAPPRAEGGASASPELPIERGKKVIRRFLDAPGWKERMKFVHDPVRVYPLMERWHADHPEDDRPIAYEYIFFDQQREQLGRTYLIYSLMNDQTSKPRKIAVACGIPPEPDICRVDWEDFVAYQPNDWEDFIDNRPPGAKTFRVEVTFSDYYNYGYTDTERYLSLRFNTPGSGRSVFAFLDRTDALTSAIGEALITQEENEGGYKLTLSLTFDSVDPMEREVVKVAEMVSPSWLAP